MISPSCSFSYCREVSWLRPASRCGSGECCALFGIRVLPIPDASSTSAQCSLFCSWTSPFGLCIPFRGEGCRYLVRPNAPIVPCGKVPKFIWPKIAAIAFCKSAVDVIDPSSRFTVPCRSCAASAAAKVAAMILAMSFRYLGYFLPE